MLRMMLYEVENVEPPALVAYRAPLPHTELLTLDGYERWRRPTAIERRHGAFSFGNIPSPLRLKGLVRQDFL